MAPVRGLNSTHGFRALQRPSPRACAPLTARFDLRGNQTDLIHSRSMRNVNHVGYIGEGDQRHHPSRT